MPPPTEPLRSILRERFALDSLYPIQQRVIERLIAGKHALVVLPTGGGKSLCYQLPAIALPPTPTGPGVTLVFSPLIALMEDQVRALRRKGIDASFINSTLDRRTRDKRSAELAQGRYKIFYATPERMQKPDFVRAIQACPGGVKLLAIDEAHCISRWGHDLRPAYQRIGEFRRLLGNPTTIALTATATRAVRDDIRAVLGLDEDAMPLFALPLDRPNLALTCEEVWDDDDKGRAIKSLGVRRPGTGIVYFALIKHLEQMADRLRRELPDRQVVLYHGRLDPRDKRRILKRFIDATPDDNLLLCATNAFGMGVDKPDIRFIAHAEIPGSVEAYFQEVGRAGRDGEPSECLLLYAQADLLIQQRFIEWANPTPDELMEASVLLERRRHADVDEDELRVELFGKGQGEGMAQHLMITLEKLGVLEATGMPGRARFVRALRDDELDPEEIAAKRQRDLERLYEMVKLTRSEDLWRFVLDYFELDPK